MERRFFFSLCAVEQDEIVQAKTDELFDLDPILCTFTLRQLRSELKRYGKEETEFRRELSALPEVESPAIRGLLRKKCLIGILLEQRKIYGFLEKGQEVKVVMRPWTRIIRTGTASEHGGGRSAADAWEKRRLRLERKRREKEKRSGASYGGQDGKTEEDKGGYFLDDEDDNTEGGVVVDPYVRKELVEALLDKYATAKELRVVMKSFGISTITPGVKDEARRVKMANNLVDSVSKKDDLFRAWKAVLLQGKHKVDTVLADDLLATASTAIPGSRGLSTRGTSSRRRAGRSRLKMRPRSSLWRPDGSLERDDFLLRPGSDNAANHWVKQKKAGGPGEEWRNRITGEIIPIRMFFSPEREPGGFGIDYLETLLSRGVSLPVRSVTPYEHEGRSLDFGFAPPKRPATSESSDYDQDFDEYFRKRRLRLKERGVALQPGSSIAYQRSLLEARRRYDKKKGAAPSEAQRPERVMGNVLVLDGGDDNADDNGAVNTSSDEDEDISDTEFFAEYVVEKVEEGIPSWFFESLLLRFGAGPTKKKTKQGRQEDWQFAPVEFRDESGYNSLEDFKFYYSALEVPVARNKSLLLRELLMRVRRRCWDGSDDECTSDEEVRCARGAAATDSGAGEGDDVAGASESSYDRGGDDGSVGGGNDSNVFLVGKRGGGSSARGQGAESDAEAPEPKPQSKPRLGWARYADDNGYPYFFNHETQESTYDNPFLSSSDGSSDDGSDLDEVANFRKEVEARAFVEFCAIMVQCRFRGNVSRNECRRMIAKRFRKVKSSEGDGWVYEDLEAGKHYEKRPALFGVLWPFSNF